MKFYYDKQVKKYLVQFMNIFQGFQVETGIREDGNIKMIDVPVHYGSRDRVSAAILTEHTQNKPIRIPLMSAYLNNLEVANDARKGRGLEERFSYIPQGGIVPEDIKVVKRRMGNPFRAECQLTIFTSNTDQQLQLLEQILIFFDPSLQIQKSDAPFDHTKISIVDLTGISFDETYPAGTEQRVIQSTLTFQFIIWLVPPANVKANFINEVFMRIGVADGDLSTFDILGEFDNQELEYKSIKKGDDLDLSDPTE